MVSLQGKGDIGNGVRGTGVALTKVCTRPALYISADNIGPSRLQSFKPSDRLPTRSLPLRAAKHAYHHYDPSRVRLTLNLPSDEAEVLALSIKTGRLKE